MSNASKESDGRGRPPISEDELLDDLRSVADELGHSPSQDEYNRHGEYSHSTFSDRFGSWTGAQEQAGIEQTTVGRRIPDEDLLNDIRRVASDIDADGIAHADYSARGEYSTPVIYNRFDSFEDACDAAGVAHSSKAGAKRIPDGHLIADLQIGAEALGHPPIKQEYDAFGTYSLTTLKNRFDSYDAALEAAGLTDDTDDNGGDSE